MKTARLFFGLAAFVAVTEGSELDRDSAFDSVDEFVTAMRAFQPAGSKGKLAALFTIPEMGHENPGKPVTAPAVESCDNIWSDNKTALLFAIANPPTVGTESHIGVLFLLVHRRDGWRIADLLRFTAIGKDSGLAAKQQPLHPLRVNSAATALTLSSQLMSFKAAAATPTRYVPPTNLQGQSLSISIWNSRDAFIIFSRPGTVFKRATACALRQKRRIMTKNIGMLLLAIYLILVGITTLFHVGIGAIVMGVLALIAGILILVGK